MPELVAPNSSMLIPGATEMFVPDPAHRVLIDIDKLAEAMKDIHKIKTEDANGFLAMKGTAGLWANGWDWDRIWVEEWTPLWIIKKISRIFITINSFSNCSMC